MKEKISFFTQIVAFFCICWGKIAAFSQLTVSGTWNVLCKIPSYCVVRWVRGAEEDAKVPEIPAPKVAYDNQEPVKVKTPKVALAPEKIDYDANADEDGLAPSRWWNLSIKTAAVAAAALIFVGGYFAVKPLLFPLSTEVAEVEGENASPPAASPQSTEPAITASQLPGGQLPINSEPSNREPTVQEHFSQVPLPIPPAAFPTIQEPPVSAIVDPFASAPASVPQAVSETAAAVEAAPPSIAPSAPVPTGAEQPAPAVGSDTTNTLASIIDSEPSPILTVLQPLEPAQLAATQPVLQPLTALGVSTFPSATFPSATLDAPPAPAIATASSPVASNFTFAAPPTPPAVNTLAQTPVQPMIALIEPVQEIVPVIPSSGTVEDVPPPVPMPVVAETPARNMYPDESAPAIPDDASFTLTSPVIAETVASSTYPNESAPVIPDDTMVTLPPPAFSETPPQQSLYPDESSLAIPRDAPITAEPPPIVVAPVPASAAPTFGTAELPATATPRIVPVDSQPLDWELWEQIREIRNEVEPTPSNLQFGTVATTASEPALRFTPRQAVAPVNTAPVVEDSLLEVTLSQFSALMPVSESHLGSNDIESYLPARENAPQPVVATPSAAYRDEQTADRGMTFQSRIDSEISRSPSTSERYVVQQGDTYMSISDRFYGTSLLYTALAQHNQKSGIGWRPAVGVEIEVPTAEYLRTHYGQTAQQQANRTELQQQGIRYIVQEGDTIFRLATDRLQDSTRWREIYALNADRLQDVRELQPGMEILLPMETTQGSRTDTNGTALRR